MMHVPIRSLSLTVKTFWMFLLGLLSSLVVGLAAAVLEGINFVVPVHSFGSAGLFARRLWIFDVGARGLKTWYFSFRDGIVQRGLRVHYTIMISTIDAATWLGIAPITLTDSRHRHRAGLVMIR